ncbi:peptide-methionine (S)-S-oxide reductase [Halovenus aranensis]|uniref:peptide-methionine (S)-S-oxide reductase n=1 Tax=Halovenus aranensis TaxID=890420 RepID=A0A1G8UMQ9_9EURY|nr:peptide-methionine (S)-S-oxide reductase [Halovenus aranensis]SDJ55196.1 peptide-methionine (S)-S-oxide reductase [Halovenus aranensis]
MTLTPTVLREYDNRAPTATETATFGLGCFWGPDARFGAIEGVIRTRAGYAGGTKPDPSYRTLGDHTEVVQVDYDPETVSFQKLLTVAFEEHSPRNQTEKRQYQNIVFTESETQREAVGTFLDTSNYRADELGTRFESLETFHIAEPYHQKFNLSDKHWITGPFEKAGYAEADIRESPAAAKLNAHVAGHDVSVPFLSDRGPLASRSE